MSKVVIDMVDLKSSTAIFNATSYIPEGDAGALLVTYLYPAYVPWAITVTSRPLLPDIPGKISFLYPVTSYLHNNLPGENSGADFSLSTGNHYSRLGHYHLALISVALIIAFHSVR